MRFLLGALAVALPAAVQAQQAQEIPSPYLTETYGQCVRGCDVAHSSPFCAQICGCMTAQMGAHWDMDEARERAGRLRTNPQDPNVGGEMSRLAQYCAQRYAAPAG